ncbi:uncharacterized protein SPSC_01821 [Sporisorium scitamineum]|uniref:Uncharacterized protein n=1 Tax=Sporisorium scitamineum TaxID=49012 RepID=A0A127ZB39_9BASI|nr:uncharacterized protein SPSC_01821 [Sporisorium scitamineum]
MLPFPIPLSQLNHESAATQQSSPQSAEAEDKCTQLLQQTTRQSRSLLPNMPPLPPDMLPSWFYAKYVHTTSWMPLLLMPQAPEQCSLLPSKLHELMKEHRFLVTQQDEQDST